MQNRKTELGRQPESLGLRLMRLWLWFVPIAIVAVAGALSVVAALDGRWGLLAVMVVVGMVGVGLLVLHWWVMYRFGKTLE